MSSHYSLIAVLVPLLTKKAIPLIQRIFKLQAFDAQTQDKVRQQPYPRYYRALYDLWLIALILGGCAVTFLLVGFFSRFFPEKSIATLIWMGIINMIGVWFLFGAFLDALLWRMASEKFKDYVKLRQIESGTGYEIPQQIATLIKLGILYYLVVSPIILYLLMH
ncbi:MAG: hypothetical protein HYU33_00415 [Candidatus Omnitrophica bacterium]|nr:hypothetical protein [Candidatus Omnitrophota bacterium]